MNPKKCERCGVYPHGMELLDYCGVCSKDLCHRCMAEGCCGNVPAVSGEELDNEDFEATEHEMHLTKNGRGKSDKIHTPAVPIKRVTQTARRKPAKRSLMAIRYFKFSDSTDICSVGNGNRSKQNAGTPSLPNWVEVDRKEFLRLRHKLENRPKRAPGQ